MTIASWTRSFGFLRSTPPSLTAQTSEAGMPMAVATLLSIQSPPREVEKVSAGTLL